MLKVNFEVKKSKTKEGYALIKKDDEDKYRLRRIWDKETYSVIRFENVDYGFNWDDEDKATNIMETKYHESKKTGKLPEVIEVPENDSNNPSIIKHIKYNQIKSCIESDIPVYLVGPAGSGKNHTLEVIANELNLDFYFTNSVQQEFKLTGFIDAGGNFHETEFYKAFKNGGLFFLDEMDASIPEVLVLLNAAIANKYFEFPNGKIVAHKDFKVVAAGNTFGNGADEQYTGRLVLDQATLDRFAVIDFDYDRNIELLLAKGDNGLVSFIRHLRNEANDKGIRTTFSYRCIVMVKSLETKINMEDILMIAVFKGMDKDTMNTFRSDMKDIYSQTLRSMQG